MQTTGTPRLTRRSSAFVADAGIVAGFAWVRSGLPASGDPTGRGLKKREVRAVREVGARREFFASFEFRPQLVELGGDSPLCIAPQNNPVAVLFGPGDVVDGLCRLVGVAREHLRRDLLFHRPEHAAGGARVVLDRRS